MQVPKVDFWKKNKNKNITFLACSSEELDLYQRWHLQDIIWQNLENQRKKHMNPVTIWHKVSVAPFLVYFGRETVTYPQTVFGFSSRKTSL